jgi:sterol 14-demethylase
MLPGTRFLPNVVVNNTTGIPLYVQILLVSVALLALSIIRHIIQQLVFPNKDEPPLVFSWLPLIGSTIEYGTDPYKFYFKYQKKVTLGCLIAETLWD